MTTSTYEVQQTGIRAFPEGNRVDFNYEVPGKGIAARASIYSKMTEGVVLLHGKELTILPPDRNEDGSLKNPNRLSIKWGERIVNLGFCKSKSGKPQFYRSLETANDRARPQTAEDVFTMLGFDQ